ncbi:MAG: DUF3124 domain-containing protein [Bradyrhizobium sp.]|nr:DUF3124 domain-containing protein [Bradyrhizobium sp.]
MNRKSPLPQPSGRDSRLKQAICHTLIKATFCGLFACLLLVQIPATHAQGSGIEQNFSSSLTGVPTEPLTVSGTFYVPVYSSVSMSQGKLRADFSVTLSVHNASETRPLVLKRVAYFDTAGKLVESYLKTPIALKPFSTIEVFIAASDLRGGTGANFVVDWAASGEIAEPAVEALMFGGIGAGHYAFISQGRPVRIVGKN